MFKKYSYNLVLKYVCFVKKSKHYNTICLETIVFIGSSITLQKGGLLKVKILNKILGKREN